MPITHACPLEQRESKDGYMCDNCSKEFEGGTLQFSCSKRCEFDLCVECVKDCTAELLTSAAKQTLKCHEHAVKRQSRGGLSKWTTTIYCDKCSERCTGDNAYACTESNCTFDLCETCWKAEVGPFGLKAEGEQDEEKNAPKGPKAPTDVWTFMYKGERIQVRNFHGVTTSSIEKLLRNHYGLPDKNSTLKLRDTEGCYVILHPNMPMGLELEVIV